MKIKIGCKPLPKGCRIVFRYALLSGKLSDNVGKEAGDDFFSSDNVGKEASDDFFSSDDVGKEAGDDFFFSDIVGKEIFGIFFFSNFPYALSAQ